MLEALFITLILIGYLLESVLPKDLNIRSHKVKKIQSKNLVSTGTKLVGGRYE